ncbi:MAG: phage tail tape measure protein [Chloroflexi bacterium]|nr:MAG: phage tail tape measure protein [Chloroflexota bacterium]
MAQFSEILSIILTADNTQFKESMGQTLAELQVLTMSLEQLSAPINQLAEQMVDMAAEFQSSLANVNTLLSDSGELINKYREDILKLSTEVPQTATELSDGLYQVISAGVDASKALDVLKVSAKAATAGLTDTFTAVDVITTILNSYKMSADKAQYVSDVLFQTVKLGKTTFGELASYMGTFAATAANLHIPIEQVAAAMATMTKQGLNTARSAFALDAILREIQSPGKEMIKIVRAMGFESAEAAVKQLGLQRALAEMSKKAEELGIKFSTLWEQRAARGVLMLANNAKIAESDLKALTAATGASEEAFQKASNTYENATQILRNSIDAIVIKTGQEWLPIFAKLKLTAADFLKHIADESPRSTRLFVGGLIMATNAGAKFLNTMGGAARNVVALQQAMRLLKNLNIGGVIREMTTHFKNLAQKVKTAKIEQESFNQEISTTAARKGKFISALTDMSIALAAIAIAYKGIDLWISKIEKRVEKINRITGLDYENWLKKQKEYIKDALHELSKPQGEISKATRENLKAVGLWDDKMKDTDYALKKLYKELYRINHALKVHEEHQKKITGETEEQLDNKKKHKKTNEELLAQAEALYRANKKNTDEFKSLMKLIESKGLKDEWLKRKALIDKERKAQEKAAREQERRAQEIKNKIKELTGQILNLENQARLEELQGTLEYFDEKERQTKEHFERLKKQWKDSKEVQILLEKLLNIELEKIRKERTKFIEEQAKKEAEKERQALEERYNMYKPFVEDVKQLWYDLWTDKKSEEAAKDFFKSIALHILNFLEAEIWTARAQTALKAIFTSGASVPKDLALLLSAEAGIIAARASISRMHEGAISMREQVALINRNEAVIPLDNRGINILAEAFRRANASGNNPIIINNQLTLDYYNLLRAQEEYYSYREFREL